MTLFIKHSQKDTITEMENRFVVARVCDGGEGFELTIKRAAQSSAFVVIE